jgi:hypothetical protein
MSRSLAKWPDTRFHLMAKLGLAEHHAADHPGSYQNDVAAPRGSRVEHHADDKEQCQAETHPLGKRPLGGLFDLVDVPYFHMGDAVSINWTNGVLARIAA